MFNISHVKHIVLFLQVGEEVARAYSTLMASPRNDYQKICDEIQGSNDPWKKSWCIEQLFSDVIWVYGTPISVVVETRKDSKRKQDDEVKRADREEYDENDSE